MRTKNRSNNNTCHSTLEKEKYYARKQKQTKTYKFNIPFFQSNWRGNSVNCFFLSRNFYELARQENFTTFAVLGHSYPSGGGA